MPKLSVVIPVYNAEEYLNQCIDSVLGQTFDDFELILVDDGSKDGSGGICDAYAKEDPRVCVVHTKNRGVVAARKTGVDLARGEYIACVDSDDWIDLDFYRSVFEISKGTNADILICSFVMRGEKCVKTTALDPGYYDLNGIKAAVHPNMMLDLDAGYYHITPSLWDKLFRRELISKIYEKVHTNVTLGEDAVCTYPCFIQAQSIYILDNSVYYHYREGHFSMVHYCDVRLLQRVCALASNMEIQFSNCSKMMEKQMYDFIAYNALYAVRQVLVNNQSVRVWKRVQAVKAFLADTVIARSLLYVYGETRSTKVKWKLRRLLKGQLYLLLFAYKVAVEKNGS